GERPAAERTEAPPLRKGRAVERLFARRRADPLPGALELVTEEEIPIDGPGRHLFREPVEPPLPANVVAEEAGLPVANVPDRAGADRLEGAHPHRVGHGLHA